MARLGDVVRIETSSKQVMGDKFWLLNLDMVEQQTGNVIAYNYVDRDALNGSIIQFDTDCVLYSKLRPNLNKVVIPMQDGFATSEMLPLRPNTKVLTREYLTVFLRSDSFVTWAVSKTAGAKMPRLGSKELLGKEIPLPSISEQMRIAGQFAKVDELIALRKEQLAKLDQLVKSRFIELFGDPNLNDKGWLMGVINDIGACVAGATPSTQVKEYWENGTIPWMSSGEVNKGRVFETDTKITQLGYDNASTKLVPPKTVVLAMAGQGRTRGTAAITEIELCTNQSICSIVNNEKVHAEYLLYFLKLQYMELRGASTNTDGRGGLNLKIIGNYPIMIPPMALQEQFAAFVEQTDKSKLAIQQSLDKLELLKKSLMQEYFG